MAIMSNYQRGYNPNRSPDWNYGGQKWKLSRSKIDLFLECPLCFYVDNKLGTKRPSIPSFNLNIAVDELLKKEYDHYREQGAVPPFLTENGLDAVPFKHDKLPEWRDPFVGIMHTDETTGLVVSGAVDDIWQTPNGELIVVDYKATSKDGEIKSLDDSSWKEQYARQISVYQWLLRKNGFTVSSTGYFVYANALKTPDNFSDTLTFQTTLVPTVGDDSWIEETLRAIKANLESDNFPPSGPRCEYCPYRHAVGTKLLAIKKAQK